MSDSIDTVKDYLESHPTLNHMLDGGIFEEHAHDSSEDAHLIHHLDEVNNSHLNTEPFSTVTVTKDITMNDGLVIPKVVKVQLNSDNNIESVVESK